MGKKVVSIEAGIWLTKVGLVDYKKSSPKIYKAFTFRTPEHAVEDGYIRDKEAFAAALVDALQKYGIKEREVVFTLASSKIVTREIAIPPVKENKVSSIIDVQIKDYFPMDVSDYVISHSKMGETEKDGKKLVKYMLVAVPNSILSNYYSFAEVAGVKIETFDYIGNGAVQLLKSSKLTDFIAVQLEEQSTVITIVQDDKITFQRITPYGFENALSGLLDYDIFNVEDEYEAYQYLMDNELLFRTPKIENADEESAAALESAVEDMRDSLGYHLNVVNTALDYYQTQLGGKLKGELYLIGDGFKLAGLKKMFENEIPMPVHSLDYSSFIDLKNCKNLNADKAVSTVGFFSIVGATIAPIDVKSKEIEEQQDKSKGLHTAYVALSACVLLSVVLILTSTVRQLMAASHQKELDEEISKMSYIEKVYDENQQARQSEQQYEAVDAASKTSNEKYLVLMGELERKLPRGMKVRSMQVDGDAISLNLTTAKRIKAEKLLENLRRVKLIKDISTPSIAQSGDGTSGTANASWEFSVTASYNPDGETQAEDSDTGSDSTSSDDAGKTE
ncbi:pilus assembly protein PilM [Eubacterium sp. MSJ-13]|uniref:pilus assembly protein PilM n=1 Tax=Eubacterium sp. MSJ-13 TaxID=2841513 RepID=UPI001C1293AC|nr:pilus assembly protein PilM [Eubacterium sp. MSJ-13]MBU5478532.1 pilus assembly protein PilM [Eubacterium sp. MSJ-13]